jgi:hypothetical protein
MASAPAAPGRRSKTGIDLSATGATRQARGAPVRYADGEHDCVLVVGSRATGANVDEEHDTALGLPGRMDKTTTRFGKATRRKLDAALDEALAHTFPASDPIAIGRATGTEPPARPIDRKPPISDRAAPADARKQSHRRSVK